MRPPQPQKKTTMKTSGAGEALMYDVQIAPSAAKKFACRAKGCTCGESMPEYFTADGYDYAANEVTVNGNYPSSH